MRDVFVSTATLPGAEPLAARLAALSSAGLSSIELGGGVQTDTDGAEALSLRSGLPTIIHNYFPPPADDFVLNLASADSAIAAASVAMVKKALAISADLEAPYYSVHAGFITDPGSFDGTSFRFPEPGSPQCRDKALARFASRLGECLAEARACGVRLLIENNVCPSHLAGKLLLVSPGDISEIWELVGDPNLGMLLDTGHLLVSAKTGGFDPGEFLDAASGVVSAFHLHENDGGADRHEPARPGGWALKAISETPFDFLPVTVEAKFADAISLATYVRELKGNFTQSL